MMKYVSLIGKPFCIILYIAGIILAVKKKFVPLAALFTMHLTEYFISGRQTADHSGVSAGKVLVNFLAFVVTWRLPLRSAYKKTEE